MRLLYIVKNLFLRRITKIDLAVMELQLATLWILILNLGSTVSHDVTTIPKSYDIVLQADLNKMTFDGNATIVISTQTVKNLKIKLSIRGLNVTHVDFLLMEAAPMIVTYKINEKNDQLEIETPYVSNGTHTIIVTFTGIINNKPIGFFKSQCGSGENISWIAGALFEPLNARTVFPVFDLSEARAAVKLTLRLDKNVKVIAPNSQSVITNFSNELQQVVMDFGEVLINNIGWVIYPSDGSISKTESERHTVLTCGQHTEGISAVSLITKEMRNYFWLILDGVYWVLLPDLSMQMATSDKIIFMRDYLMEQSDHASSADNYENLMAVTEGYAQQLFGRVITSNSWSDLWITKGLSKFFRYKITGKIDESFNSESYIAGNVMPRVLERENIPHSMSKHVDSTRDLLSMYDEDLFDKAGLVMRMLEDIVGEDNFKRAIEKFALRTTGDDYNGTNFSWHFWNSLFESSDKFPSAQNITAQHVIMRAWFRSDGYPIVYVRRTGNSIHITQVKSVGDSKTPPGYWWVPISVTSQSLRQPKKYWLRPNGTLTVSIPRQDEWYMINENSKGLYRVNYDMENWKNLSNAIANGELNGIAKSRIIDDTFGLAEQNLIGYSVALAFSRHLAQEFQDQEPWAAAVKHLLRVKLMLSGTMQQNSWNEYISMLVKSYVYGVDLTSPNATSIRNHELKDLDTSTFYKLSLTHELCRDNSYCSDLYHHIPSPDGNSTSLGNFSYGDMLSGDLCYTIEADVNSNSWEDYMKYNLGYKTITKTIVGALGCSKNTILLYRFLNELLGESPNASRQSIPWFMSELVYVSVDEAKNLTVSLENNLMTLLKYITDDPLLITNLLLPISERVYNEDYKSVVTHLFDKMDKSAFITSSFNIYQYHRAIRRIETNLWQKRQSYDQISHWLKYKENHVADFGFATASNLNSSVTFCILSIFVFILRYKFHV